MGWFSKKTSEAKTQGIESGLLARELIQGEFLLTSFFENGKFSQPNGLYQDPYVVGFLHGYLVTMADVCSAKRRKHWTEQEGAEFMLSAMETIVGYEQLRAFIGEPRKCKDSIEYKDAYSAANALIKAMFTSQSLNSGNSLVSEASALIRKRENYLTEMFPESRRGDFLAWAVKEISITRHIQRTYIVG